MHQIITECICTFLLDDIKVVATFQIVSVEASANNIRARHAQISRLITYLFAVVIDCLVGQIKEQSDEKMDI